MEFWVRHETVYTYDRPVRLGPHVLRLRPRCDAAATLVHHELRVEPEPAGRCDCLDLEGNWISRVWFLGETRRLAIYSEFQVRTLRVNPYDYLPESAPGPGVCYADPDLTRLRPWIDAADPGPETRALAAELWDQSADMADFLHRLNAHLRNHFTRGPRETGHPLSPAETLRRRHGACRDLAVLFIAVCRTRGIAARFVSGYQEGDGDRPHRAMHAWPEVYLPGGGWRGFDPTHGLAVADGHVAVAAAAESADATPVAGGYVGEAHAALKTEVRIHVE